MWIKKWDRIRSQFNTEIKGWLAIPENQYRYTEGFYSMRDLESALSLYKSTLWYTTTDPVVEEAIASPSLRVLGLPKVGTGGRLNPPGSRAQGPETRSSDISEQPRKRRHVVLSDGTTIINRKREIKVDRAGPETYERSVRMRTLEGHVPPQ